MPELTFIFGPNKTFFFDSPKSWKFHNIPPTLRQLFNSSMSPDWRIAQPYCLALGPQVNSPEPIWFLGCKVLSGEEKLYYSQSYFDINYPDLSRWTKSIPNAPRTCFITFGTGLSYFGCAQGHGSVWAGVSSELTDKVQKAFDTPCCVSLGQNGAWFVMWPDGYYSWKFYGNYTGLDKILNEAAPRSVAYVAISPYNREHYFISFKDRTVKYNFNGVPEWIPQIQEVFNEWQAEILQSQGIQQQLVPPQWNQYLPRPGQPAYVAAHYANSANPPGQPPPPQFSPYSPYGGAPPGAPVPPAGGPHQFAVELPGDTLLAPPQQPIATTARPASIMSATSSKKKHHFFSRKKHSPSMASIASGGPPAPVPAPAHARPGSHNAASAEGSQTCNVM